ncbi:MAG: hypothetical protein HY552_07035 [Elusimicrobia bacterium]|nr:hypothetical protein [Elusimicrobiota bacterium]
MRSRALAAAALLAAAGAASPASADNPGTLVYDLAADVDTLDPAWAYDSTSLFVISQMYEGLVAFDGPALDRFQPRLASVVPTRENGFLSADGLTYAFPLRRGVTFHDGSAVTPADVKYSLMRFLLTDRDGGPSALLLEPLIGRRRAAGPDGRPDPAVFDAADKAVSIEGGALVLRLKKPFAPLLSVLAGFAPAISRADVAAHGGWDGTKQAWPAHWNPPKTAAALHGRADGTGPFKLAAWDRAGRVLLLARHDGYWRRPAALAAARLETVPDDRERRRRLLRGDADVIQADPVLAASLASSTGVTVEANLPALEVPGVVLFNFSAAAQDNPWLGSGRLDGDGVPPDFFADRAVRKAFALAFDGDAYIRESWRGLARRAAGPIPPGLPGYTPTLAGWTRSLELAAQSLRSARGGAIWAAGFRLPVAYVEGRGESLAVCRRLRADLAALDPKFRVECRGLPQPALLGELRARRPACLIHRWILDYPDSHNAAEPFLGAHGVFAEPLGYANPKANALVEQAAAELDPNQRKPLYAELQALAVYDAPQLYTVNTYGALARRAKVLNWTYNPVQPHGNLYEVSKLP